MNLLMLGPALEVRGGISAVERLVLELVAEGHSNRSIAQQLGLSARTVQFHLSNLFAKAQVKSRTGLVHVARDLEWLG